MKESVRLGEREQLSQERYSMQVSFYATKRGVKPVSIELKVC